MKKIILFFFVFSLLSYLHAQNFEIKVACVGNSITEGFGRENGDSYPNQLDVLLGDKYDVRNFGVGGRTMLKNGDFPYWNELQFEMAQDFDPDIVIILLGTNDSKPQNWLYKDEYYFDYVDMVNVFRYLDSEPEIFVSFPPPVFQTGWGINDSIIHFEIIPLVDSVRTSQNTFHINFYNTMTEMSDLFPDGIHPNAEGYGEMARIAAEAIINRPSGVIHYFYTDSETIEEDEDATLYWQASDSSVVTLDNQTVKINDSLTVSPLQTTEYTLITNGEFQDTSMVLITFLPSGLIKSFYGNPHILEKNTGDSSVVFWETTNNSQSFLAGIQVAQKDSMIMTPYETTSYTLVAEGTVKDTSLIMIEVLDADEINRSLLASSFSASSTEFKYSVESAFDSDTTSYWLSEGHSAEWIAVDLDQEIFINRSVINWGDVYAKSYRVEVIDEQNNLSVFSFISDGHGGIDDIGGDAIKGKQVRILC
ncbi:MAG: hypothetical protein GY808_00745, partial [Gammaproteobacteria bacterium]|nr:hypothetical protein [Gammaproteobacteria bacterium]